VVSTQPIIIKADPPKVSQREAAKPQAATSYDSRPRNSRIVVGCLLLGGIVFGAFLLTRRSRSTTRMPQPQGVINPGEKKAAPTEASDAGLVRYKNTEIREIQWDYEHMVPTKIILTRESLQLP